MQLKTHLLSRAAHFGITCQKKYVPSSNTNIDSFKSSLKDKYFEGYKEA
jgi:hypothetical protein